MLATPELPIPTDAVPERLRRFADPNAPTAAKMMAARGTVPVKGGDLVLLLVQLTADADPEVSQSAGETLQKLPENVLLPACEENLHAAVFHEVALRFPTNDEVLARLASNHAVADATVVKISTHCPERITEIIAVNQQRLLGAPQIIEALYKNRNTRMSTADRLVELAARHEVELTGIPMFAELKKAIQGQLIPEPSDEPLPGDQAFSKALEEDADQDAVERDKIDGTEETKEEFVPLQTKIRGMNIGEKIRMAASRQRSGAFDPRAGPEPRGFHGGDRLPRHGRERSQERRAKPRGFRGRASIHRQETRVAPQLRDQTSPLQQPEDPPRPFDDVPGAPAPKRPEGPCREAGVSRDRSNRRPSEGPSSSSKS